MLTAWHEEGMSAGKFAVAAVRVEVWESTDDGEAVSAMSLEEGVARPKDPLCIGDDRGAVITVLMGTTVGTG